MFLFDASPDTNIHLTQEIVPLLALLDLFAGKKNIDAQLFSVETRPWTEENLRVVPLKERLVLSEKMSESRRVGELERGTRVLRSFSSVARTTMFLVMFRKIWRCRSEETKIGGQRSTEEFRLLILVLRRCSHSDVFIPDLLGMQLLLNPGA